MKTFWKDILDDSNKWAHLEITVSETPKSRYHIQAGGRKRFKLTNDSETIFWGCIDYDYYGVWFLRNEHFWETDKMFIPPITSANIEESIMKNVNQDTSYWSKFFTKSLSESKSCFLNDGVWKISEAKLKRDPREKSDRFEKWKVNDLTETYEKEKLSYIDWGLCGNSTIIPIKKAPLETDGRLKWWKKKVRENTCPPILTWYVNSLDAFVLIDGHYRLKANMLENKLPKVLVLNELIEQHFKKDDSVKEKILKSLELRQNNQRKEKINITEVNNLLIHAFDNRPSIRPITRSVGKSDFEENWVREVLQFKDKDGIDSEELKAMIVNK